MIGFPNRDSLCLLWSRNGNFTYNFDHIRTLTSEIKCVWTENVRTQQLSAVYFMSKTFHGFRLRFTLGVELPRLWAEFNLGWCKYNVRFLFNFDVNRRFIDLQKKKKLSRHTESTAAEKSVPSVHISWCSVHIFRPRDTLAHFSFQV